MKIASDSHAGRGFLFDMNGKNVGRYSPRKAIFSQGDSCESIFYVDKGRVKLTVVSKRGKEAVVAILGPGDFLGEECLTGQKHRTMTAIPLSESTITKIDKAAAMGALRANPRFSEALVEYLLGRIVRAQEDLVDQLFNSSEKRLARILLLLAGHQGDKRPEVVVEKISQETLAEMIGTTRSRVNYFMNKFRRLGFIKYNGHLQINRPLLSAVLHE